LRLEFKLDYRSVTRLEFNAKPDQFGAEIGKVAVFVGLVEQLFKLSHRRPSHTWSLRGVAELEFMWQ